MQNPLSIYHLIMNKLPKWGFLIFVSCLLLSCASNQNKTIEIRSDQATLRTISAGNVIGYSHYNNTFAWLGIPYAKPPVGDLRWKAPRELEPWQNTYEALDYGQACTQTGSTFGDPEAVVGSVHGSEDCLYLNIFTPKNIQNDEKLPVMYWVHGGSNIIGTSSIYDPSVLASSQRVVVVTINYRLGMFGWFIHPSIKRLSDNLEDQSGNYGTLDQIAALRWVQKNIEHFGGDINNVTIFGESAGGHNVYALMFSPLSEGLFHKVISQSGSTKTSSLKEVIDYSGHDAELENRISSKELLNQLLIADGLALNWKDAIEVQDTMTDDEIYDYLYDQKKEQIQETYYNNLVIKDYMHQVINDGHVLPRSGMDFTTNEKLRNIPIIMGTNRDEMKLFLAFDPDFISQRFSLTFIKDQDLYDISSEYGSAGWKVAAVDKPASELAKLGNDQIFGYRFDWDEEPKIFLMDLSRILGAAHAIEIPFVMGGMELGGLEEYMFDKNNIQEAKKLSEAMMSYWSEFAYNGNPGRGRNGNLVEWGAWNNDSGKNKFLIIDTPHGGGTRMEKQSLTYSILVEKLLLDTRIPNDTMRCQLLQEALNGDWVIDESILNSGLCNEIN